MSSSMSPLSELLDLIEHVDPPVRGMQLARVNQWLCKNPHFLKDENHSHATLCIAIRKGDVSLAQCLMDHGADVSAKYKQKRNDLLIYALSRGREEMVHFLVNRGIPIQASEDPETRTPLMWACLYGMASIIERMIEKGVNINHCNAEGSALILAVNSGSLKAVQALVERGADLALENKNHENALRVAQKIDQDHPGHSWAGIIQYLAPMYAALQERKELQSIIDPVNNGDMEGADRSTNSDKKAEIRRL